MNLMLRERSVARVGYARVSTTDQDLSTQVDRLKAAGCEIIRSEKISGTTRQARIELNSVVEFLRRGDELVVTRIDRLARSIADLQDIVRELKRKGAFLRAADQPIDTRRWSHDQRAGQGKARSRAIWLSSLFARG
jgi:DNA invertase Pin-like site-specific DNA recombinase